MPSPFLAFLCSSWSTCCPSCAVSSESVWLALRPPLRTFFLALAARLRQIGSSGPNFFHALVLIPAVNGNNPELLAINLYEAAGHPLPTISIQPACLLLSNSAPNTPHHIRLMKPVRRESLYCGLLKLWDSDSALPAATQPVSSSKSRLRILLAEDNLMNQRLIARLLEKIGHTVTLAVDGLEALHLILQSRFDLVLMDMRRPVMDGVEATRKIRYLETSTGRAPSHPCPDGKRLRRRPQPLLHAGMDGFLAKSVSPARFAPKSNASPPPLRINRMGSDPNTPLHSGYPAPASWQNTGDETLAPCCPRLCRAAGTDCLRRMRCPIATVRQYRLSD